MNQHSSWKHRILQDSGLLYFIESKLPETGLRMHTVVLVSSSKDRAFRDKIENGHSCTFADYGEVLASGWGHLNEAEKQRILQEYEAKLAS